MFELKKIGVVSFTAALLAAIIFSLSTGALADHSRKRGRHRDKKAEKFINGHDARDGRLDGRGPRLRDRQGDWNDDDCCGDRRSRRKRRR